MYCFRINIGNYIIELNTVYPDTLKYSEKYLCTEIHEDPVFVICSTKTDIENEKLRYYTEFHRKQPYSDGILEFFCVQRMIAGKLLDYNILLFHGSSICVDNNGYLFLADSGVGKSTHVMRWKKMFGNRALIINDDKPFVKVNDKEAYIFGSPWNGKENRGSNIGAPLSYVLFLERGIDNRIWKLSGYDAYLMLIRHLYKYEDQESRRIAFKLAGKILNNANHYGMCCNQAENTAGKIFELIQKEG